MGGWVTRPRKAGKFWGNVSFSGELVALEVWGKRDTRGESCGGKKAHRGQRKDQSLEYLGTSRVNEKGKFGEFEEEGKPGPGSGVESH